MKNTIRLTYFIITSLLLLSCSSTQSLDISDVQLADETATPGTKFLYKKIKSIAQNGIAIGHQDATAYGIGWKASEQEPFKNDMFSVVQKNPVVHGWDVGHIELNHEFNLDTVSFSLMKEKIKKTDELGGITTISWHLDNPVSNGSSWDTTPAVTEILKGGSQRDKYLIWVKRLSIFFKSLRDTKGDPIPVVFRPYHEMNGGWFWWGAGNCTVTAYKMLYQDLVTLLKQNGVHNLLYAYSPNTLNTSTEYTLFYPGDEYVDILGIDIYNHSGDETFARKLQEDLKIVREFAEEKDKPFALSETGNTKPGNPNWWTEILYPGIQDTGIAWVLFWRNARVSHYFGTYPDGVSALDFKKLEKQNDILFLEDLKTYTLKN